MHVDTEQFKENSKAALLNDDLQQRLRVLQKFTVLRNSAFASLDDGEALRDRARQIKEEAIAELDSNLTRLEQSVSERGGIVHWARSGDEACQIILDIAVENNVRRVVKSKSMVTEELDLNEVLQGEGIDAVETDLGEYIVQVAGEKPFHILAPAVHKSKADIARLFAEKLGAADLKEAEEMTRFARGKLRERFLSADMGITGANFAVAETGTIVLVENEGNIRLSTTLPRIHVAVVGIEKVIPRLEDLAVFLKILARSASGQKMSSYVSLITGPRRAGETDGAGEFHLILLDNGRTRILADEEKRESLYCLRCGACLNVCPVYQKIGGHAYGSVYSGPIGSIITPPLAGLQRSRDLPFASTLCGACRDICPVRINIPHVLLRLRAEYSEGEQRRGRKPPFAERAAMRLMSLVMRHPSLYSLVFRGAAWFQGPLVKDGKVERLPFPFKGWTDNRDFPPLARRSFRSRWRDMEKG